MLGKEESCKGHGSMIWIILLVAAIGAIASGALLMNSNKDITINTSPEAQVRTLNVNGQAQDDFTPDKAEITFSVITRGTDPTQIQTDNDATMNKIIKSLKALGIPEINIKTVSYDLSRWTEWDAKEQKSVDKGYQLTNTLRIVTYDVKQAGGIASTAVQNGANDVGGVTFSLSDNARDKAYNQLLQLATSQAKQKAQTMAGAAGTSITKLRSMNEGGSYTPYIYENTRAYSMDAAGTAPKSVTLNSGTVQMSVTVSASYEISG